MIYWSTVVENQESEFEFLKSQQLILQVINEKLNWNQPSSNAEKPEYEICLNLQVFTGKPV